MGKVCYFMDTDIGGYYYGQHHPMKPHRLTMTHNLMLAYGLHEYLDVYRARLATTEELSAFHSSEYIDFLRRINPDNAQEFTKQLQRFNVGRAGGDNPVFDGLFDYCRLYASGSIDGAKKLLTGKAQIAINWAGGLHHAKKSEASGFCYVNDIVLAILEFLKFWPRVVYIDIDVHHGDGVEEAFYVTDRVMTVSFHKYGDNFFPGTGDIWDKGSGAGEYYAVNVPLKDGIDDESYFQIFKPVVEKVFETFQPSAVVLQCGTDSLARDRLGGFNLTVKGHARCVEFVKSFGVPMLVVGGGGYNIRSVARCWLHETSVLLDRKVDDRIPYNDYWEYFAPEYRIHQPPLDLPNKNDPEYLDRVRSKVLENIRHLTCAPSVQMQEIPPMMYDVDEEEEMDPDQRGGGKSSDWSDNRWS